MSGELKLSTLLATLTAVLDDALYVFVTVPADAIPGGIVARMMFHEAEGVTLILPLDEAEAHDLPYEFPSRMITLNVHSALEAVGFIAHISTRLAAANMGVNPIAGFYHDHLFIPDGREEDAMDILHDIAANAAYQKP